MYRKFQISILSLACCVIVQSRVIEAQTSSRLETVAISGQPVVGSGGTYASFFDYSLNEQGVVAFAATLEGLDINENNDTGIWTQQDSQVSLVVRAGQLAPGTGNLFTALGNLSLNDIGQLAFQGQHAGEQINGSPRSGVWSTLNGTIQPVAIPGTSAPGTNSNFLFASLPSIDNSGRVAIAGGSGDSIGIWAQRQGQLRLIAHGADPAPLQDANFGFILGPQSNLGGDLIFNAFLDGPNVAQGSEDSLWIHRQGESSLLIRAGADVPDASVGTTFDDITLGGHSGDGGFFFTGGVSGLTTTDSNDSGVWQTRDGQLTAVALEGQDAPGIEGDVVFRDFRNSIGVNLGLSPVSNASGDIAFVRALFGLSVDPSNDRGLWVSRNGMLELVAREGESAPGVDGEFTFIDHVALSDSGVIAFSGGFRDSTLDDPITRQGIWISDGNGELSLIAAEGLTIDVSSDPLNLDLRTIDELDIDRGFFDESQAINSRGELLFDATFIDGTTGLFLANSVASIPEPSAIFAISLAGVVALLRRRCLGCQA